MRSFQCAIIVFGYASVALVSTAEGAVVANPDFKPVDNGKAKLKLCESDCDKDSDCVKGLICADGNKPALNKMGLNNRTANCDVQTKWNYEVCFDPKILLSGGAGGGTLMHGYPLLSGVIIHPSGLDHLKIL